MSESAFFELTTQYPKGTRVTAQVHRLLKHGAEVALPDGTEGIIRNRELSWDREPDDAAEILHLDQTVSALVLDWERERHRLELSLRQAERDPWESIEQRHSVGQICRCRVVRLWRGGAFAEIEPALDGFVPLHEVNTTPPKTIEDVLWIGDTIEAAITRIDPHERKIDLSIRERLHRLRDSQEQAAAYARPRVAPAGGASFYDALKPEDRQRILHAMSQRATAEAAQSQTPTLDESLAQKFPCVFIAEDDPSFRGSLARLLERLGHTTHAVENAEKAAAEFSPDRHALVLMDLGFSTGSLAGLDAIKQILARSPQTPVVIITGVDWFQRNTDIITEAKQAGAKCALVKPVDLRDLQKVMRLIAEEQDAWQIAQVPEAVDRKRLAVFQTGASGNHRSLEPIVRRALGELQRKTGAAASVLFRMEPISRAVSVFAHVGAPLNPDELTKHTLQATPVGDVVRHNLELFEPDTTRNPSRFRHLQLLEFSSCIGVPVPTAGQTEYAVFLFHPQRDYFKPEHLAEAVVTAGLLGGALVRAQAEEIVQKIQPLLFIGQLGSAHIHELNNRLGGVHNHTKILRSQYEQLIHNPAIALSPDWKDQLGASIKELDERSTDISNIAKLYLGLLGKERHEPINVNQVLTKCIRFLKPFAQGMRVTIVFTPAADLPSTMSISIRLEQAFLNVMLNAVQQIYQARAGGVLTIETHFQPGALLPIQVRFRDTGPGIHQQHQNRIFDLGFTTREEGTGIGLFVTKNLLESCQCQISVAESIILIGTTFLIELPMIVPSVEDAK